MGKKPTLYTKPYTTKNGTVYSQLPLDGSGDWTFSRDSIATRVDENGIIETVAANIPRIDYSADSRGCLLLEPERTNILIDTDVLSTQSVTTTENTYVLSFYGTGTITLTGTSTDGPLVGTGTNERVYLVFTPTAGSLTLTVTGSVLNAQLEQGTFPTSYIPTTVAEVTRAADYISLATDTNNVLSSLGGTLILDLRKAEQHTADNTKGLTIGTPQLAADYGSGAAAAYSLRYVSNTAYEANSPVVRMRRSIDDAEADFTPDQLLNGEAENWVRGGATELPLDISGSGSPAAAYSLRALSTSHTGPVVRVRRSSDNAESDFTAAEVSDGTMLAWVNEDVILLQCDFTDSNSDGLADCVSNTGNATNTIVTGNGHIGNAQRIDYNVSAGGLQSISINNLIEQNCIFEISFLYRSSINVDITNGYIDLGFPQLTANTGDAIRYTQTINLGTYPGFDNLFFSSWLSSSGHWFEISDLTITQKTSNGLVTTWYDQSGNNNHTVQTTAANQPLLVQAGSLITENALPAIQWDGTQELTATGFGGSAIQDTFFVMKYTTGGDQERMSMYDLRSNSTTRYSFYADAGDAGPIHVGYGTPTLYVNGVLKTPSDRGDVYNEFVTGNQILRVDQGADTSTWQDISFGFWLTSFGFIGTLQDLIIYNSDKSADRTAIEAAINSHYSIYGDGYVTTWYDQSGNGNHATQSAAGYQPKLVSSGSLITENGKPCLSFDGVDDVLSIPSSTSTFNFLHNGSNSAVIVVGSLIEDNSNRGIVVNNGRTTSKTGYVLQFEDRSSIGASRSISSAATKSISGQFVFSNTTANNIIDNDTQFLIVNLIDGDNAIAADRSELYVNSGGGVKNNTQTNAPSMGDATNDLSLFAIINGNAQEIVIYPSDQSANRTAIEQGINNYYNIYGTPSSPTNEEVLKLLPSTTNGRFEISAGNVYSPTKVWEVSKDDANVALRWNGTNFDVFEDGVLVATTGFTRTDLDRIALDPTTGYPINLSKLVGFNHPIDGEEIKEIAQSNKGLLDFFDGAAAAYSLRSLSETWINNPVVRVRRSSDNAESDFTAKQVEDGTMLAWVNAEVVKYTSDFTSGNEGGVESNGTGTDGETVAGVSDAYKFTLTGGSTSHNVRFLDSLELNKRYRWEFQYYIPSTNAAVDSLRLLDTQTNQNFSGPLDTWNTASYEDFPDSVLFRIYAYDGTTTTINADGDVFYLKNIRITQTTADGHVTTWYDQSGDGNNATQATAAKQPKIVDAGTLVTENSKPAVDFDGTNDVLRSDFGSSVDLDRTLVVVGLQDDTTDIFGPIVDSFDESPDERLFTGRNDNDYVSSVAEVTITNGWTTYKDLQLLHFAKSDNLGNGQWWINGSSVGTGSNSYGYNGISIGAIRNRSTVYYSGGTVQEVILYLSDQSSNRTAIESEINGHYNIY